MLKDFPCDLVVKIPLSNAGGASSISGQETKIPHSVWSGKKKKRERGMLKSSLLIPMNMPLFESRVFADIIK